MARSRFLRLVTNSTVRGHEPAHFAVAETAERNSTIQCLIVTATTVSTAVTGRLYLEFPAELLLLCDNLSSTAEPGHSDALTSENCERAGSEKEGGSQTTKSAYDTDPSVPIAACRLLFHLQFALRARYSREIESFDNQTINAIFDAVRDAVNDLAFFVTDKVATADCGNQSRLLHPNEARHLTPPYTHIYSFLSKAMIAPDTIPGALIAAIQFIGCWHLHESVFAPFWPTHHDRRLDDLASYAQQQFSSKYHSQEERGQFRVELYRAFRTTSSEAVTRFERDMHDNIVDAIGRSLKLLHLKSDALLKEPELATYTARMVRSAVKFQDMALGMCTSLNYSVSFPKPSSPYNPSGMDAIDFGPAFATKDSLSQHPTLGVVVALPMSLGLCASTGMSRVQGHGDVVRKAEVVISKAELS